MSEPRRIELNLLGQTLTIRSEASPDYLRRLAKFLEDRVAQLKRSGVNDPLTALSLAALDITDELFRTREDKSRDEDDVGARLGALVALLDKVTPREGAGEA
jgi:cell division protein ZapA (FtsZ GTPase activity inhibitor)